MQSAPCESYLVTEVMTSTPQKLQLMLVEGAIRAIERGRQKWRSGEDERACEALIRAQEIVGQMLDGLDAEIDPELVNKVAAVYLFVFRSIVEANYRHDEKKLDDALRVLEIERGTWRQVCAQLGSRQEPGRGPDSYTPHAATAASSATSPASLAAGTAAELPAGSFSLEA